MPNEEISDEELLLRKRARRRLIGAFVVVIAMVLILPAVLEDKPQPVSQNVEIVLPPPASSAPNPPVVAIEPSVAPALPSPSAPVGDDARKPASPAEPAKVNEKESAPEPIKRSAPEPTEAKPTEKPIDAKPVETKVVEAKPKTPNKPGERFQVQVGVFSNSENVKQLLAKLSAQGVKARSETLADGKIRVRAGPYPSRPEAERVVEKIRAAGVSAVVVKVAVKP